MDDASGAIEFSRPVEVESVGPEGFELEISADEEERRRVSERLEVLALEHLTARLVVKPAASGVAIRVQGNVRARVVQRCIVSLERVVSDIEEPMTVDFGPTAAAADEIEFDIDDVDPPEPLDGDRIDVGELVVQHVAVALDPYPRKTGAALPEWRDPIEKMVDSGVKNPFSVLASLKKIRN